MKKPLPFHPLLFALYPALFLYSRNSDQLPLRVVVAPALLLLAGALALWGLFALLLRGAAAKAAAVTSLFVVLFFLYGPVYALLLGAVKHRLLLPVFCLLFALGALALKRRRGDLAFLTGLLNVVSGTLVLLTAFVIAQAAAAPKPRLRSASEALRGSSRAVTSAQAPDIYYIILDACGGERVLEEYYREALPLF